MKNKVSVVIVLYNQWCGDSLTCQTIMKNTKLPNQILIVDNSTKNMNNEVYCMEKGWMYHSMQGNAGLSKAYNKAIDVLKGKTDIFVWADDDTEFPDNYFEKLLDYSEKNSMESLFIPIVKSKDQILSPAIFTDRLVLSIKNLDELKGKRITAINSGLAVRMEIYDNFRYDENIFLDYVDHDFVRWCRLQNVKKMVMEDVVLKQSFFLNEDFSKEAWKHRDKIFCKDIRYFEKKCKKNRIITEWDLLKYHYFQWRLRRKRIKKQPRFEVKSEIELIKEVFSEMNAYL